MCMITYVPAGVPIPVDGVKNGATANDDGHGWAVASGDRLLVGHSMRKEVAIDDFEAAREELGEESVALFHSRFGTHGAEGEYNIHPFFVGDEQTVMAHNGILPEAYWPEKNDPRSDTRIFVDLIGELGFVDTPTGVPSRRGARRLGREIGDGNKLIFLSVKSGEPKVRIVGADQGIYADGGVWYSNSGYRYRYTSRYWGLSTWSRFDDKKVSLTKEDGAWRVRPTGGSDLVECGTCGHREGSDALVCSSCLTCFECFDSARWCDCWSLDQRPASCILCLGTDIDEFEEWNWCNDCGNSWVNPDYQATVEGDDEIAYTTSSLVRAWNLDE